MVAEVTSSQSYIDSLSTRSAEGSSKMSEAENRFLKLLTTQMQNQDPLNPLDNAEVTSQLAQISTVNGIETLNNSLQELMSAYDSSQSLEAAALIGHDVLVPGSQLTLGSAGAAAGLEISSAADEVKVTIEDPTGVVVRTINLGASEAGSHFFSWDGLTDSGGTAAEGNYTFKVEAARGGETVASEALALHHVFGVQKDATGIRINLGDSLASLADIRQIL